MENIGILLGLVIIVALIFLLSGLHVGAGLGLTGFIFLFVMAREQVSITGLLTFNWSNSMTLTAIPLFIFMGEILLKSGISEMLFSGVSQWVRNLPGGLLHVNIVSCALFSAASGSSVATAATVGAVSLPSLMQRDYNEKLTLGSLAAGGTLGILIPPSVCLIIYGALVGESVGQLFMAGIIPGIILTTLFMAYIGIVAMRAPSVSPREAPVNWHEKLRGLLKIFPMFFIILIVLGTIYGGVATPTEAAALGVSASLLFVLLLRKLTWQMLKEATFASLRITCMVFLLITGSYILSHAFLSLGITRELPQIIIGLGLSPLFILIGIYLMYTLLGMFIDTISMMVVTLPIVYPLIIGLGFNSVWFGIVMVLVSEMGLISPPVGANLYVIQGIREPGRPIADVIWGALPFFLIIVLMLVIITAFPILTTWLPSLMFAPRF